MEYRTLDPATGELVETFPLASEAEIGAALGRATAAFGNWRAVPFAERAARLLAAAELLERDARAHAELMAEEMGKPCGQGEAEAKKCAWVCRYYAERGELFLAPRAVTSDGSEAWVRYDPLGPLLAIMPWNFPYWQVFRFAAPALAAGNVVLLKHAPNTPRCARAIESVWRQAGVPQGVFQNLFLSNRQAAAVISHPAVRGVTLTGSTRAGREVAATAGRALKPMVMELGGSDPFIVFEDADLESAAAVGTASRCLNSGQSCIAAKRFLVQRPVFDRFAEAMAGAMAGRPVGDPRQGGTEIGPLARQDLCEQLTAQVSSAREQGAAVLYAGSAPAGPGFFHPAMMLTGLAPEAPAAREELFGPVATLFPFDDEDEAVAIANATDYGLGAALWTTDRARVERLVPQLDSGSVFVNGMVKSDPRLPFGGVKDSGFGRELAQEGLHEWVNVKTVWIG